MNLFSDEAPIVAGFVWILAAWTVSVHIAAATGGSFNRLLEFTPIAMLAAAVGWFACRRQDANPLDTIEESTSHRSLWLLAAALVLCSYQLGFFWFWLSALILVTAAWFWFTLSSFSDGPEGRATSPALRAVAKPPREIVGLIALCSASVFITLLLHQPDIDDAFYISVAADAHRHPDRAIWSTDTIHDDPTLPVFLPIYKAESYEYLIALIAKALNISSVRAAHTALPIAFSILVALSWAMLARTIDPRNWLAIAAVTVVISVLAGATKPGPANYAFTRLQQGKSVMVSAIVPILCVYAFRLATLGGWRNAVMLTAAQIAGVGLSSTSIVIAPAVVCAVGIFCLPFDRCRQMRQRGISPILFSRRPQGGVVSQDRTATRPCGTPLKENLDPPGLPMTHPFPGTSLDTAITTPIQLLLRSLIILATCLYPISMALLMRNKMLAVAWLAHTRTQPAAEVLTNVLGDRAQLWFFLATLVGAWVVVPRRSQPLVLAPCILLLGVMINPLVTHLLQTSVFTPNTYWRGLWVLPWLVWSAVFICGLSTLVGTAIGFRNLWLPRAMAVGFAAVLLTIPLGRHPIWRHQNGTTVHLGGLAVDEPEYSVAEKLATQTPPGTAALAPEVVACWTAVLDQRPRLIFVRSFYTQSTPSSGGMEDVRFRNQLGEIAGKHRLSAGDIAAILRGADRYRLGAIVLLKAAGPEVGPALTSAGFSEEMIGGYSLWIRQRT